VAAQKDSAFLFDLDGTLIDSVCQHVIAWREALAQVGVSLAVWKIHRRIGMSGGLFVTALQRIVVGDSVWDLLAARRAGALGIGLLSGGYGREELIYAGAFRVYEDPGDLLAHLDEVGVRRPG
jgi:phosphoglycolate phosphatase-like HAD superfamily hydrolase